MSAAIDVRWVLAALMIAASGYHGARVVVAVRRRARAGLAVDLTHAAMGIGMTIMLVGPMSAPAGHLWAFGLAVPACWFAARAARCFTSVPSGTVRHDAGQAVLCGAMIYLLVLESMPGIPDMSGMPMSVPTSLPMASGWAVVARTLAMALLLGCLAITVGHAWSMWPRPATSTRAALARAAYGGCQMAMGLTTVYMLDVAI